MVRSFARLKQGDSGQEHIKTGQLILKAASAETPRDLNWLHDQDSC